MINQAISSEYLKYYDAEKITLNHKFKKPFVSPQMSKYINYGFKLSTLNTCSKNQHFFKSSTSIQSELNQSPFYKEFILINPKGVIADDFMLAFNIDDYTYVGVIKIDFSKSIKTMISMVISQYIDSLVNHQQILTPSVILNNIQEFINDVIQYESLDHFSKHDLMISLACIDKKNQQIIYSGSHKDVFLTLNDYVYDVSSNHLKYGTKNGTQTQSFKDYIVSIISSELRENIDDFSMDLYFSNLSNSRNRIN